MKNLNAKILSRYLYHPFAKVTIVSLFLSSIFIPNAAFANLTQADVDKITFELGYSSATPIKEIENYRIEGFNTINDRSILLNTGPQRHYLITLTGKCFGLVNAEDVGFTTTVSELTRFDSIIAYTGGIGADECPIDNIYKLDGKNHN